MRKIFPLLFFVTGLGCRPDFATVEEACDGKVPGSNNISNQDAIDTFARINCYRRLAKMSRAPMSPLLQEAVENHNAYQLKNATEADLDPWNGIFDETVGLPEYTGVSVYDRLEAVDYPNLDRSAMSYWEWSYQDTESAVDRIDFWFPEPHVRQSYLQPAWVAGGYAEGPTEINPDRRIAYVNIFYQVPIAQHISAPVVFPKDGQEDVPTSFEAVWQYTASFGMGRLGYPITVTAGGSVYGSGNNPHGINVRSSSLTGPDGKIDLMVETPETHGYLMFSAAFYPMEPLAPNSEYTFEAVMDWDNQEGREIVSTFRTGPEFEPHGWGGLTTARGVPRPPTLRTGRVEDPSAFARGL